MDNHETVVHLIGAWALDACSTVEEKLVESHLGTCPACTEEARGLREAAAGIVDDHLRPPAGARARLLSAARSRRRPAPAAPAYAAPYAAQIAALELLLSDLAPEHWRRIAADGELTVHDLLAHLAATDGLVAAAVGVPVQPPTEPGEGAAARTAAVLRRERQRSPEQTMRSWRAQADAVCHALLAGHPSPGSVTVDLGWPLPLADALTARAFEIWIHREDIAAATGRRTVTPLPEHLHPMADLAVRLLPRVTSRRVAPPLDRYVRWRLTGAGEAWTVPLHPSMPVPAVVRPAAVLTLDVVEFCRLVGGRRDPARIAVEIEGDTTLAREVLAAAPAMAPVP
ncbi:maleylpyruvate isomerase family mycothiol-dependent enzyme [Actinoplanes sp. NEAU-A12]|uniref:Maleylpyruvate isomerase family mycothiol-dependent enzyme n=2 Tax=Actinoplanes sandaracinus TaxID=3045177 RepID=A0ABT6X0D7_9ACTN|nr:maleylpyruvate isomerase family mycothiol-dependent enzyme [Actinoplanes sandaracinus]